MTDAPFRPRTSAFNLSRATTSLLVATVMTAVAPVAVAQVNVETLRTSEPKQGLGGLLEGNFTGRTGNTEGMTLGAAGRVDWLMRRHLWFLYATAEYSRINHETNVSKSLAHLRYNYRLWPRLWAEVFTQIEHDRFRRLTDRELIGTGPRVLAIDHAPLQVLFGTAYMLEREKLNVLPGSFEDPLVVANRWSNYVTVKVQVKDRIALGSTTYAQPRFDDFGDCRFLSETLLEVGITDVVASKLTATIRSDTEPPVGVKATDTEVKNSIAIHF